MSQSPGLAKLRPSRSAGNSQSCLRHHGCLATSSQRGPVAPRSRAGCGRVGRRRAPACTEGAHTWPACTCLHRGGAPHLPAGRGHTPGRCAPAFSEGARTCLHGRGARRAGDLADLQVRAPPQEKGLPSCVRLAFPGGGWGVQVEGTVWVASPPPRWVTEKTPTNEDD